MEPKPRPPTRDGALPLVELSPSLSRALSAGHPWVYRDHVPRSFSAPSGAFVRIVSGTFSAVALWDPDSALAFRVFSRTDVPDAAWILERVRAAWALRDVTRVLAASSAYRFLNGEGDGIPGITVDRYGPYAVLTTDGTAAQTLVPLVVRALEQVDSFQGIVRKVRGASEEERLEVLTGRLPPRELVVEENGIRFVANLHEGQKTGLFLDQRENRHYVETVSAGKRVLNLFGYTGGFSLYAARGGAAATVTVDVAEGALVAARENFRLNGFPEDAHVLAAADVFDYVRDARARNERFGVVICDPPSFARSKAHRDRAIDAYVKLHAAALAVTEPGGLYAASSCTTQISVEAFHGAIAVAARKAGVKFQIVRDSGHPTDHPIAAGHPEGRYLKFVVGRVTPRA